MSCTWCYICAEGTIHGNGAVGKLKAGYGAPPLPVGMIAMQLARLAVLISGAGRTLANLAETISVGELGAEIVAVVSSRRRTRAARRARRAAPSWRAESGMSSHAASARATYSRAVAMLDAMPGPAADDGEGPVALIDDRAVCRADRRELGRQRRFHARACADHRQRVDPFDHVVTRPACRARRRSR